MAWDGPSSHASIASLLESSRSLQPSSSSQPLEAITIINNPVFLDTQHQRRYIASGLAQSGTVSYSRTSDRNPPLHFLAHNPAKRIGLYSTRSTPFVRHHHPPTPPPPHLGYLTTAKHLK
jgi:hypothetical protein